MNESDESTLLAHIAQQSTLIKDVQNNQLPGDLNRLLSSNKNSTSIMSTPKNKTSPKLNDEVDINVITYRRINTLYCYSRNITKTQAERFDRGANGALSDDYVRIISKCSRTINVQGIDNNHQCTNIPIGTAGAVIRSQRGPDIIIMNQYIYIAGEKNIYSSGQIEDFKNDVNDKSIKVSGGTQYITTPEDHAFPLNIKS